jgi:hypothetical protein
MQFNKRLSIRTMAQMHSRNLWTILYLGGLGLGVGLLQWMKTPSAAASWIPLPCPLYVLFHIQCPTCGLGRSLLSALGGQWQQSWDHHPLGLPLLIGGGIWILLLWVSPHSWRRTVDFCNSLPYRKSLSLVAVFLYCFWGFQRP